MREYSPAPYVKTQEKPRDIKLGDANPEQIQKAVRINRAFEQGYITAAEKDNAIMELLNDIRTEDMIGTITLREE